MTGELVAWREDPTVATQRFGRRGSVGLFVVGQESPDRFLLLSRSLLGPGDGDGFGLVDDSFSTAQQAQQFGEERLAHLLDALGLEPRAAA